MPTYSVQVGYWEHRCDIVQVEAESLEDAIAQAVASEELDFQPSGVETQPHIEAVGLSGSPWVYDGKSGRSELRVPGRWKDPMEQARQTNPINNDGIGPGA